MESNDMLELFLIQMYWAVLIAIGWIFILSLSEKKARESSQKENKRNQSKKIKF